jgi:hypothetical protein
MEELLEFRDNPELHLVAEVLASGGTVKLRAFGNSMLPSLWPGDILTIEGARRIPPVPGDIVLVLKNQRPFIHRVEGKRESNGRVQWITRGDAIPESDPPVDECELLGRISSIQRHRRVLIPRRQISHSARLLAWMLYRWDRFRGICLRVHLLRHSLKQEA